MYLILPKLWYYYHKAKAYEVNLHMVMRIIKSTAAKLSKFLQTFSLGQNTMPVILIIFLVATILAFVVPLLPNIPGHPDEHQFYNNAWSIMGGKKLHNYLHVAVTEYLLAFYLSFVNAVFPSGVNFPQGYPTAATYFYGRIFGLMLWLLTYIVSVIILQKDKKIIQPRIIFFTILYFGSIGLFERFIRVNSDSMAIFVVLNYVLISFIFHRKKSTPFRFFVLNLIFVFLVSFTNLKALYMALPIFVLNSIVPFVWYEKKSDDEPRLPAFYRLIMYSLGVLFGSVVLWYLLIPKPIDVRTFWMELKHATVASVRHDYQYPGLAHKSWLVYLYDLFVYQVGITQSAVIGVILLWASFAGKKPFFIKIKERLKSQMSTTHYKDGNAYLNTEIILLAILILYYIGLSSVPIHWSRWGAPLGFFFILIISPVLEYAYHVLVQSTSSKQKFFALAPLLIIASWSLFFLLILSIKQSDYPTDNGYKLVTKDFDSFLKEKDISDKLAPKKVGWFLTSLDNIRAPNFDITKLGQKDMPNIDYLVWPQWFTAVLYSKPNVDLEIHNIKEFIKNYTTDIIWRFPSPISYYVHFTKWFAQGVIGITWVPEVEALTETQYAVLVMKKPLKPLALRYEVPFEGLEHYYSPKSHIFTIATLNENTIFPPCHGSPTVLDVSTGRPSGPPKDPLVIVPINDMHCHSLGIRMVLAGKYRFKIEGLPENKNNEQKVYSAYPIEFEAKTKTISQTFESTKTTAAFGVATKQKKIKDLKFIVDYKPL